MLNYSFGHNSLIPNFTVHHEQVRIDCAMEKVRGPWTWIPVPKGKGQEAHQPQKQGTQTTSNMILVPNRAISRARVHGEPQFHYFTLSTFWGELQNP